MNPRWQVANPRQGSPKEPKGPYEFIEHTADVGVRAYGPDLPALFQHAALGMMAIMTDPGRVEPRLSKEIGLEAEDRETLLVEWLSEIIFLIETENLLFSRFDVSFSSDTKLTAIVAGEPLDTEKHDLKTQVKAVTLHNLAVKKTGSSWVAQVIFDV